MEFWELRETIRQEESAMRSLYAELGGSIRSRRGQPTPPYMAKLAEAADFVAAVYEGRTPGHRLVEAMSTSDFPLLFGDILDRQLLANYREWPVTWPNYCKRGTVRDFRTVRRIAKDGLEGRWYPGNATPEMQEPEHDDGLSETGYTYSVQVYQKATAINWRMLINDDLSAFTDLPARLARGARRSEEYFATSLFVDANGPHASLYTAGNGNIITGNPVFGIAGLQTAMTMLGNMVDADGEPIMIEVVHLVVPPALEVPALNILNGIQLTVGAVGDNQLMTTNWMRNRLRLHVNPYIPIVASSANGASSWFLFADPGQDRPAIEIGFLRGYEEPSLFQKAPNTQRLGGAIDPMLGDFETNEITYKGMHIFGGTRMSSKATLASNGSAVP
jgi:hypothetical protein